MLSLSSLTNGAICSFRSLQIDYFYCIDDHLDFAHVLINLALA